MVTLGKGKAGILVRRLMRWRRTGGEMESQHGFALLFILTTAGTMWGLLPQAVLVELRRREIPSCSSGEKGSSHGLMFF
jgi:hypothetical protein